ncbi:hypothetical protein G7Y89_g11814 [Cudoniella acicularis]|uniref:Uncharacterized protein n=1 Tax=Cudoniella acicularis TaxID=354080 RepID=A0A8H4RD16_9HELO|nr:hypothetical protein G7Y89_g11814 [Cudoniella acicularis]
MSGFYPIVTPPLEHTHKSVKYTCSEEGLAKDGWLYDPNAERFLRPKTSKAGATPKEIEKKPLGWWKAQCSFRGLNQTGAINDLQLRLREAKKKMLPELKAVETELIREFKKKNKAARDGTWASLKSVEQKAKANPSRFLAEAFPKGANGRPTNLDIIILKIGDNHRLAVATAAEDAGLETVSVDALWTANKKPNPDRWIIIGRTRDAVWNQMREIERESARSKQIGMAGEPGPKKAKTNAGAQSTSKATVNPLIEQPPRKKQTARKIASNWELSPDPIVERPVFKTKQTARKTASNWHSSEDEKPLMSKQTASDSKSDIKSENSWDVRGRYLISCPGIEEEWSSQGGGDPSLTLDVYLENKNGRQQLYAVFDFRVIKGIMRFEKPVPASRVAKAGESSSKRKREDIDDDGDAKMEMCPSFTGNETASESYTENVFYLGAKDKPTARRPTWRYRWRGEETGEGEIQLGSDKAVQCITYSNKGTELSGTFKCSYLRECNFTGVKIRPRPSDGHVDPEAQWTNRSQAAYDYASRARWG